MKIKHYAAIAAALIFLAAKNPVAPVTWGGTNTIARFMDGISTVLLGNGFALIPSKAFFGDCSDGDFTFPASGTTVLSRDMYWNNVSWPVGSTATLSVQNQRVFWCGTLDLTNAPAFAIDGSGAGGTNGGAGGAAGSNGNAIAVGTNITGRSGGNGGAGNVMNGAQGAAGSGGNVITGSAGGSGGKGGNGGVGTGGALRAPVAVTNFPMRDITTWFLPQTGSGAQIFVGGGGSGGAGGGGDGVNSGGGGGGGGASGNTVYLSGNILVTGAATSGATITSWGGGGGNGGSPTAGDAGGGGGGGPGSGGWIVLKYNTKTGPVVTALLSAIPNVFVGVGGTGHGTGANGQNGDTTAAQNGLIQTLNFATGVITTSTSGGLNL